jgi:hypothetical protein
MLAHGFIPWCSTLLHWSMYLFYDSTTPFDFCSFSLLPIQAAKCLHFFFLHKIMLAIQGLLLLYRNFRFSVWVKNVIRIFIEIALNLVSF